MSDGGPASAAQVLVLEPDRGGRTIRLDWSERALAIALCALLFFGHLAFGAARREVALAFAAAQGLLLAILIFSRPWARRDLQRAGGLAWPALCFAALLFIGLLSLTPLAPGGPHPIWSFVQASPAAAVDKSAVVVELVQLMALGCVFLTAWVIGADDDRARWFLRLLTVAMGIFAIWAFISHLADPDFLFGSIPMPSRQGRLSAAFLSPNTAGAFFGIGAVLATCALTDRLRSREANPSLVSGQILQRAAPRLVAICFCVACLMLTASRGGVVATGVALAVFLVWEAAARRWRLFGLPGLGLVALMAVLLSLVVIGGSPLIGRMLGAGGDVATRQATTSAHWHAFLAAPWMGYGLGSFDAINRLVTTSQNYPQLWNIHAAHNVYLQWLEEAGVLGASAMFLCIGSTLALTARGAGRRVRMTTWIRGLVAASLVPLIHGVSDFALQVPSIAAFLACLLGLGMGVAVRPQGAPTASRTTAALPWAVGAFAMLLAGIAGAYAVEKALFASAGPVNILPLPEVYDVEAARARDSNALQARALSLKALAIRPVDSRAWLNLAQLGVRRSGRLDAEGVGALQRSYDVSPYDPQLLSDRVAFAYDHWADIPSDIRGETLSEIRAAWPYLTQKDQLFAAVMKVTNPNGKFALATELFSLKMSDIAAENAARKRSNLP